jgi:uncharacterized protein YcbK (DUF882 family)
MRLAPRSVLRAAAFATAAVLASGSGDAAPAGAPVRHARIVEPAAPRPLAPGAAARATPWAASLPAVHVKYRNTGAQGSVKLYAADGGIDRAALRSFMRIVASTANLPDNPDGEVAEPLDPRLVQLVMRASYKFGGANVIVVSAMRKGAHGKHGSGDAIDFQLEGVKASVLAAYLFETPRAGVGIYTHPKTQYVHLDVRDHSYHWLDGSPPNVTWREKLLPDPKQASRDASYVPALDLPESAR